MWKFSIKQQTHKLLKTCPYLLGSINQRYHIRVKKKKSSELMCHSKKKVHIFLTCSCFILHTQNNKGHFLWLDVFIFFFPFPKISFQILFRCTIAMQVKALSTMCWMLILLATGILYKIYPIHIC